MMAELVPELNEEIVAQVGPDTGSYPGITSHATLPPAEFGALFSNARVVVAHAGIGSILSAKAWQKPLVLVPRRHHLNEHRNDHQQATARQVEGLQGIYIAWTREDLIRLLKAPDLSPPTPGLGPQATRLVERLRNEVLLG
jgi:UDP-N-acetylglucosamine transferase subunit ALG13